MLHGVSFGLFYPNMISYGSSVAPKGAQATVQGIVKSLFIVGKVNLSQLEFKNKFFRVWLLGHNS